MKFNSGVVKRAGMNGYLKILSAILGVSFCSPVFAKDFSYLIYQKPVEVLRPTAQDPDHKELLPGLYTLIISYKVRVSESIIELSVPAQEKPFEILIDPEEIRSWSDALVAGRNVDVLKCRRRTIHTQNLMEPQNIFFVHTISNFDYDQCAREDLALWDKTRYEKQKDYQEKDLSVALADWPFKNLEEFWEKDESENLENDFARTK